MLERFANAPHRLRGLSFELLRRKLAQERKQRGARGFELMEKVTKLVLFERTNVLRNDPVCRHVANFECVRIEILPVLDGDAARIEQLEIRAEGATRVRDGLIPSGPRGDAAADHRDMCEPVRLFALEDIYRQPSCHALTQTF